jgi:hypothetical protein
MSVDRPFASEDESEPYVCHRCIAEPYLNREIRRWGRVKECDHCNSTRLRAVSITWLARRIDDVYREMVSFAEEEPRFVDDSDNVSWVRNGERPSELICELIKCADDKIAEAIVHELGAYHGYAIHQDGDDDWNSDTSDIYKLSIREDEHYREAWSSFCKSLKHERRFFSATAKQLLDEILGPIITGKATIFTKAIREIGPNADDRFIYRGRLANDVDTRKKIYAAPIAELGAPPAHRATAGRMNPAGISIFYAGSDPVTCVAELRVPVRWHRGRRKV